MKKKNEKESMDEKMKRTKRTIASDGQIGGSRCEGEGGASERERKEERKRERER
jgi:hypothetical protein